MPYSQGLRILLVDDDESFVSVLAGQLRDDYGFATTAVYSGDEAVAKLEKDHARFDIVLLDYMMPGMTGIQVLQWMHEQKDNTPVVMLTGAGSEQVAVEAMKLGAYDYVRKELIEIQHLALVLNATHERHQFRVARELEEEQAREVLLNREATERTRDVINAITPTLNSALASIDAEIEAKLDEVIKKLPKAVRFQARGDVEELQRQVRILETGIRGLLSLYQLVHAHHTQSENILHVKQEFEERLKTTGQRVVGRKKEKGSSIL